MDGADSGIRGEVSEDITFFLTPAVPTRSWVKVETMNRTHQCGPDGLSNSWGDIAMISPDGSVEV